MKPIRTIVVDDNSVFLESISTFLSHRESVDVTELAHSGPEALQLIRDRQPDLVLVDLVMPKMDGLELTEEIKALPNPPRVIILTLADHPAYSDHAAEAGADALLSKYELTNRLMPLILELFPERSVSG